MERQKYPWLLTLGFLFSIFLLNAQPGQNQRIYEAYITGDMEQWQEEMNRIERLEPETLPEMLELAEYYYGYTAWLIGNEQEKEAKSYIKKAESLLKKVMAHWQDNATAHALAGAFSGYRIGLSKFKALFLGPKSMKHINRSLELDPENIQGLIEKGNTLKYMPAMFGGNKGKAAEFYERAIWNMEESKQAKNNWLYLNQLVVLAQIKTEIGNTNEAGNTYQKILQAEPGFLWVRDELYPAFLKGED